MFLTLLAKPCIPGSFIMCQFANSFVSAENYMHLLTVCLSLCQPDHDTQVCLSAACLTPSMPSVDCMLIILICSQAVEHVRQGLKAHFARENCSICGVVATTLLVKVLQQLARPFGTQRAACCFTCRIWGAMREAIRKV